MMLKQLFWNMYGTREHTSNSLQGQNYTDH